MIAPAVISLFNPGTEAMPMKATPTVPAVVHELPVTTPSAAQIIATSGKKISGRKSSMP